jgi:voltage-gated potassium channel
VILAALATIPLLILEQNHPPEPWRSIVYIGDWIVWSVFAIELIVMLAVVPSRWQYIREHPIEVAIVLLTLPILSRAIQAGRVFRVLRVMRLLRLGPLIRRAFSLEGLRYATVLSVALLVGGAEAFAAAEKISVGDAVYWALGTMTTVGYGDITPKTVTGKVVACTLMVAGIGFFALITGAFAQRFLAPDVEEIEAGEGDIAEQIRLLREQVMTLEAAIQKRSADPDS